MVDGGKELAHVQRQDVGVAAQVVRAAVEGAVRTLALAVGVGVVDEAALEERLDDVDQGVVYNAIAERGGGDQAALRPKRRLGSWIEKLA